MAYTTQQAITTLDGYLQNVNVNKTLIEDTKNRGFLVETVDGDKFVIFVYPLVHKQDNTKNYFDTRDSGAYERGVAWRYAQRKRLRYFCFGVNDQVDKYKDYIFSLECDEREIERVSGTKDGVRNGPGNQIIIPNDYVPAKQFERIKNRLGIYISAINKSAIGDYIEKYDNRPYMLPEDNIELLDEDENQAAFEEWMRNQVIPEGDSNAGSHYSDVTIQTYVSDIKFHKVMIDGQERTLFATNDLGLIEGLLDNDEVESARKTAIRKYKQFVLSEEPEEVKPISYRTGFRSAYPLNRIVFGAPGTGKSFTINRESKILLGDNNDSDYERVTFHPDYSYANFVGTYKPVPSIDNDGNETITYEYVPGPFMRVYVEALRNSREEEIRPFLLIIEEINRANVAAVFGDIFQLLDRDADNVSEYPIQASEDIKSYLVRELGGKPDDYKKIRIPDNMFIWATMNSADQGVFPMDTAFKRRWDFTYLGINDSDKDIRGKYVEVGSVYKQRIEWNSLRKAINDFLASEKINEDKQLGPYFISRNIVVPADGSDEIDSKRFCDVFKHKVLMYLFDDAAKQKRAKLFEGCQKDKTRYSEICKAFDDQGIGIFNGMIQNQTKVQDLVTNNHELDENGMIRTEE